MELVTEEELEVLRKDSDVDIYDAIKMIPINEKSWIPEDCGAYIITTINEEKYVGSSSNILDRIVHHHIRDIDTVDVYLTSDYQKLEKWFIHQMKPSLNIIFYNRNDDKTITVSEDIHRLIDNKRIELRNKGQYIKFYEVTELIIKKGLEAMKEDRQTQLRLADE